jgi:N-acetylneuraminate synthase
MSVDDFEIAGREIGPGHSPYIVAEMSANHGGDYQQAVKIVEAAAQAGADAVKLQMFSPESLTLDCDAPAFRIQGTPWSGRTLYDLYSEAATPWEWYPKLRHVADQLRIALFATPYDEEAVDFLASHDNPAYKIASFELVDIPLLRRVGQTGRPVILSTGMASLAEIDEAVATVRDAEGEQLALLKCTSAYPADPRYMNLQTITHLAEAFDVPVGLSDHSLEWSVPVAAVAVGASIIEKHLTLSRRAPWPDSSYSLEPEEFQQMVAAVRTAHAGLGTVRYGGVSDEAAARRFRRSLFVVEDIKAGEEFTEQNVRSIRPSDGLHTRYLDHVLGSTARCDIPRATPLQWHHLT